MALDYGGLLADLGHESDALAAALAGLPRDQWELPTPAAGWSIRDQISHLAFFDDAARLAMADHDGFRSFADELVAGGMDFPDRVAERYRQLAPADLMNWFAEARGGLLTEFGAEDPKRRLPWFGPDMSVASSATARLMETWAHSQDVYDAIGVAHPPSPGLHSIAHLGVATFAFAHILNGLEVPRDPVRVELESPDGDSWHWGPPEADNRVCGPALHFVLTVTQRRHWTETDLTAHGAVARSWLDIAQAFAGAPSRRPARAVRP